jgi:hypothetical protein
MKKYEISALAFFGFVFYFVAISNLRAQNISQIKKKVYENKQLAVLFHSKKKYIDDTTDDTLYIKKRFWRASGELMLVQVIPWAYN